jgi:HAD superfamily hydrolase (TIGR01509 family)
MTEHTHRQQGGGRSHWHAAIIFDADGTLIDSEVPGLDVIHQVALEHGIRISRLDAHDRFRGVHMTDVVSWFARALPDAGTEWAGNLPGLIRARLADRFKEGIDPMPGATSLLSKLRVPFCVATNGPPEKVSLTLSVSGLASYVGQHVYSAHTIGCFKPEPGLFLHAANQLGADPHTCAVVEDSLPGVAAGVAAGMHVYALMPPSDLPPQWAAHVTPIPNLQALEALLHPEMKFQ